MNKLLEIDQAELDYINMVENEMRGLALIQFQIIESLQNLFIICALLQLAVIVAVFYIRDVDNRIELITEDEEYHDKLKDAHYTRLDDQQCTV
jgi:hypothetical protein